MQKVLEWCLDLGVETLTVYAFSIDNFKRPQIEVDTLMDLVRTRFRQLLRDEYGSLFLLSLSLSLCIISPLLLTTYSALLQRRSVRVRILGEIDMLPDDVQEILAKAAWDSRNNTKQVLLSPSSLLIRVFKGSTQYCHRIYGKG